jgi:ADP-ribose pyrophosphatase YjhB (NUDIX family)
MPTTHLLARAVLRDAGHVLLVRADGQSHTFLPGGHVEAGEGLEDCLRRELHEELGVTATVGAYRGAVEHRWRRDDTPQYELNHCFAVDVSELSAQMTPTAREGYLTFGWVPVGEKALAEVDLQPAPLRRLLTSDEPVASWWASTLNEPTSAEK